MTKQEIVLAIETKNPSVSQILGWVKAMPNTTSKRKPNTFKVGDVLMHPIFNHPYVLLEKKDDCWICCLITSEATCTEILEPCKSRFFEDGYIAKTIITAVEPIGLFMNVYENTRHLKVVLKKLKEVFK